jgi:acyl dehydratase
VFAGDTLRFGLEVRGARRSRSKPGLGPVELTGTADRGDDTVVSYTFVGSLGLREPS